MQFRRRRELFGHQPRQEAERPLTVTELNRRARACLERDLGRVWVAGEVSNLTEAPSGHLYFTLKDDRAQIAVVMWRSATFRLGFRPADGEALQARGRLTLYEERGTYQLVADALERVGAGDLEARFKELKRVYEERGWFAPERKRPLPVLPRCVAVVTSPRGAAIHDILRTIDVRHPRARVVIVPVRVQGLGAAAEIADAMDRVAAARLADVMIVGRGGGSLEDLWAFNEPAVVEAVHRCPIPVVSAVGHEVDFSLADLVADRRAPTPTAAGEMVVPELARLEAAVATAGAHLGRRLRDRLSMERGRLHGLGRSWALREPRHLVARCRERLDALGRALPASLRELLEARRAAVERTSPNASAGVLAHRVTRAGERLRIIEARLVDAMRRRVERERDDLAESRRVLETLSPFGVLARGYSITTSERGVVTRAEDVAPGERLVTRLADGSVVSRVEAEEEAAGEP